MTGRFTPKYRFASHAVPLLLLALALGGCGRPGQAGSHEPLVVTSITPLGSILRNVAGNRARVEALVPDGESANRYRASPGDLRLINQASLVLLNGLGYDDDLAAAARSENTEAVVEFGPNVVTPTALIATAAGPSPFLWVDPKIARSYAGFARAELTRRDPDGAGVYQANFDRFDAALERLDLAVSETVSTIPSESRKLLTEVDAFRYFARSYGIEFVGSQAPFAMPPNPNDEVAALARAAGVKAVFKTSPGPNPDIGEIAREGGARIVDLLRYEVLPGPPGNLNHTYLGLEAENTRTMAEALGGSGAPLSDLRPNDIEPE